MSKTIKTMILREYASRIGDNKDAMLISIRGVKGTDTTRVRNTLAKKNIRITVMRNSLARKAFEGTSLESLRPLLSGASALAYGGGSVIEVAREVVALLEKFPGIELKGAVLDGLLFEGKKGCEELSKFPTRNEAIGQIVTLVVSPAKKLVAQLQGPGGRLSGIIKSLEQKLEKGEAVARIA